MFSSGSMERAGNLDWLRLIAAGMVICSHQLAVFKLPDPEFFDGPAAGAIGVYIFFAISGYVNTKSILQKRSVVSFLIARVLRIYPGVIVCSLFRVAFGSLITVASPADFWRGSASFLLHNSTLVNFIRNGLPGVFLTMLVGGVANVALWTLSYEVWATCRWPRSWLSRLMQDVPSRPCSPDCCCSLSRSPSSHWISSSCSD